MGFLGLLDTTKNFRELLDTSYGKKLAGKAKHNPNREQFLMFSAQKPLKIHKVSTKKSPEKIIRMENDAFLREI